MLDFRKFTESLYKYMWILPKKFQEISRIYGRIIRSSIGSIEFDSILR